MKILVAYDGSEPAKKALDKAIEMTTSYGGELALLTVTEPVCPLGVTEEDCGKMDQILKKQTEEILSKVKQRLEEQSIKASALVRVGSPADEIINVAEQEKVDMIVLGSHGRHGAKRFFLGSVSSRVASHANCSVIIVK
jgi:nucleotide-binding universal stress UspA family protein